MNLLSDQVLVRIPSAFETLKYQCYLVRPEGFEPPTNGFGSHYSIQLSYERTSINLSMPEGWNRRKCFWKFNQNRIQFNEASSSCPLVRCECLLCVITIAC